MNDLTGALGLSLKAGALKFGFENALNLLKKRKNHLVLVSKGASEGTKKRIKDKCSFYETDLVVVSLNEALSDLRVQGNVKIISVTDINLKNLILKSLKGET